MEKSFVSSGKEVSSEDIAEVVSSWTGIPATQITKEESEKLLHLEDELHKRIVGQDKAVSAVARAIRRGRAGLKILSDLSVRLFSSVLQALVKQNSVRHLPKLCSAMRMRLSGLI